MAQSGAIIRYLAKQAGLSGDNDAEFAFSEMLIEESQDLISLMNKAFYAADKNDALNGMLVLSFSCPF